MARLTFELPFAANGDGALSHTREAEALARPIDMVFHADPIVADVQHPVGGLVGEGDAHDARVSVPYGIAYRFLGNAQHLVLVLGAQTRRERPAFKHDADPTRDRGSLG
jgi:hypothetical protein